MSKAKCLKKKTIRVDYSDKETGEITATRYYNSYNTIKKTYRFIKLNKYLHNFFISTKYMGYFLLVITKLERYTNRIVMYSKRGVPIPMNKKMLCEYLDISRPTLNKFLEDAAIKNIIKYNEYEEAYFVNPNYAINGKSIAAEIDNFFME
jgi:hypothetical protein